MRNVWIGAVLLLAVFTALPALLSPRATTLAAVDDVPGIIDVCQGCNDGTGYTRFTTCNRGNGVVDVTINYLQNGDVVGTETMQMSGQGCNSFMPDIADGFPVQAVINVSPDVAVIASESMERDGSGPSAAYPVPTMVDVQPTYSGPRANPPSVVITETLVVSRTLDVCNVGTSPGLYETSTIVDDGSLPGDPQQQDLQPGDCDPLDLDAGLPVTVTNTMAAGARTFSDVEAPTTWDVVVVESGDVPDRVPGQGPLEAGERVCTPAMDVPVAVAIQSLYPGFSSFFFQVFDANGDLLEIDSTGLGTYEVLRRVIEAGQSACFNGQRLAGTALYRTGDCCGGAPGADSPFAPKANGSYFDAFRLPHDPVTKRAFLAGAVRNLKRTRVNVVMQNLTNRRAKARIIVRDGDGSRIFARTVRAAANATGRRKFIPRARGDDLWVDVRVRGGNNQVFLWLERIDRSGDVTLFPAVKLR